jgi:hypothetical protein
MLGKDLYIFCCRLVLRLSSGAVLVLHIFVCQPIEAVCSNFMLHLIICITSFDTIISNWPQRTFIIYDTVFSPQMWATATMNNGTNWNGRQNFAGCPFHTDENTTTFWPESARTLISNSAQLPLHGFKKYEDLHWIYKRTLFFSTILLQCLGNNNFFSETWSAFFVASYKPLYCVRKSCEYTIHNNVDYLNLLPGLECILPFQAIA